MTEETPKRRTTKGRRRPNVPGGRTIKHEVWVSPEEEGELYRRALAQDVTIPRFLYESATAPDGGETTTARREQLADLFRLHRSLASVGNNLNQIARATNAEGTVPAELRDELAHTLAAIRRTAEQIDQVVDHLGVSA
jgi:hypothetical protein